MLKSRVLVIDDDPEITESLRECIEAEGYEVDVAFNGKQGLLMQRQKPYELIITDIIMPEEDGLEVIMEVKFNYPMTKVIAISGGGYVHSTDYLKMAKELGAVMVLTKPFNFASLRAGIKVCEHN